MKSHFLTLCGQFVNITCILVYFLLCTWFWYVLTCKSYWIKRFQVMESIYFTWEVKDVCPVCGLVQTHQRLLTRSTFTDTAEFNFLKGLGPSQSYKQRVLLVQINTALFLNAVDNEQKGSCARLLHPQHFGRWSGYFHRCDTSSPIDDLSGDDYFARSPNWGSWRWSRSWSRRTERRCRWVKKITVRLKCRKLAVMSPPGVERTTLMIFHGE